jgi:hypothetical protein
VRTFWVSVAVVATHLGTAPRAAAQDAVPSQGDGTVSVTYQNYHQTGHFDHAGQKNTNGPTQSHALITQLDVGITDAIGLNVTLPFIASKYTGPPFYYVEGNLTFPGPLDDHTYHATFQDLRVEARRMLLTGPVTMVPFVSVSVPTHAYETVGEAVPGRHRRELQVGVAATADLDAVLAGTYVHGRYAYAALERVNGFPHTRSNIDVEAGHDITSHIGVRFLIGWQIAHTGPTIAELIPDWVNHDRFINSNFLSLGGGASLSLTRATEIYAVWDSNVRGSRGAHVARTLAIGVSRSFGGGFHGLGR